jgi:outer membrane receptor for ferrienterochelin and colicins
VRLAGVLTTCVVALACVTGGARRARAAEPEGTARVPVRELPPLPDVESADEELMQVALRGATEQEEDVVVGASKREQSLGSVASAVTIVSAERLRRFGYRTLAEALEGVVGLYIVDDRMVERLGIRGVQLLGDANTRILVLVDGSPVNEPWGQYVDTSYALPVHLDDVARIEIIRGPVSSIYGTNAFLGIVNIVTLEAGSDRAARAYGRAGVASFGALSGNAGFNQGGLDRQVRASVAYVNRGGEDVADGLSSLSGSLTVQYDRLFFHVRGYDRTRELPGAPYDSAIGSTANTNRDRQLLGEAGYTQSLGPRVTLAARVYADRYQLTSDLLRPVDDDDPVDRPFRTRGNATWYGGEVRALSEVVPGGLLSVTTGVAAEWSRTASESTIDGVAQPDVDRDFDSQGLYVEASSAPWPWLALTAGVRYDRNALFENRTSPRGALFLRQGERYGLKLLYAQGFRNPSIFEAFYADGARYVPSLSEDGTRSLLFPESITSYEAVLWGRPVPGLNLRLSGWQWDLDNLIEKASVFDPIALEERLQFKNIFVGLRSRGVEAEASYRDTRGWLGFANATYAAVKRDPGAYEVDAINSPAFTANLGVSTPLLYGLAHVSTELGFLSARHTREVLVHRSSAVDADAYLRWNLVVYFPGVNGFDVTVGVRNILGVREEVPVQSDYDRAGGVSTYVIPGAGRELYARVGYRY